MAQRKKYSVYGSCQAPALAKMLNSCPTFARDWELVEMEPCFVASEEQIDRHLAETIPKLDLFLYQPVSEGYRGEKYSSVFLRNSMSPGGAPCRCNICIGKAIIPPSIHHTVCRRIRKVMLMP